MVSDGTFQRPPEAPVYRPTEEEFLDPMKYIKSIRPTALKWGICKIIPPAKWMPPFALDVDQFEFPTRIQKLSELGAHSRVKYIFYEKLAKFWDLQGLTLTIPVIEKRAVDLYGLHSLVKSAGGANVVTRRKRWQEVAKKMGFVNVKLAGSLLRRHYERILRPYDKLEKSKDNHSETNDTGGNSSIVSHTGDNDSLENCVCFVCNDGSAEERVLLCDGCDGAYHTFCLDPPLKEVPPGDWLCPQCLSSEVRKPPNAYGFEQADRMYTLLQFGEMADTFKTEYFNMLAQDVPLETVEKEFWRIVSSVGESVTVEYGADLHAMDHGSAFPTMKCLGMNAVDGMYAQDKWNLNNIPVHKDSALRYLKADLSGMKIPWMYVGMCFSTFCWHTEDHWNYSINYMHWGEAKTWYGVPGSQAELFEETFRKAVPELFTSHPDVLHHLVTLMHPNTLMQAGVSVCRTDQFAGEFVVTFPKAYHAGFNQGYNFAEAVNFALPDWLSIGRECVRTYSLECRHLVFSHDELVCSIAANAENLSPELASETVRDMQTMIEEEKELRHKIGRLGVIKTERVLFELVPDDERQCEVCKTTCFLSAITCSCKSNTMVCLRHYEGLCDCPPDKHVMKYRYTLEEVGKMKEDVESQYLKFKSWICQLRRALDNPTDCKKEKIVFKKYLEDGKLFGFFDTAVYQDLEAIVEHGDSCSEILQHIFQLDNNQDNNKDRMKTVEKGKFNLTLEELEGLRSEIERLPFAIEGSDLLSSLISKVKTFKLLSYRVLNSEDPDVNDLNTCINLGENIEILLPEMPSLKKYNLMFMWLNDMKKAKHHQAHLTLEIFKGFLSDGVKLPVNSRVEKFLSDLQALTVQMECWENRVNRKLQEKSLMKLAYIKERLSEAETMNVYLPSAVVLREILHKSSQWISQVKKLDSRKEYPYETTLEKLVQTGSNIPAHLVELPKLELRLSNAKAWKSKASRIFLRKNSHFTLMDALAPRVKFGLDALKICRTESDHAEQQTPCVPIVGQTKFDERLTTQEMVEAFSLAADNEINSMNVLRLRNKHKRNGHTIKTKYCICRKPLAGVMLECQLCRDLFHRACVPCSKSMRSKDAQDIKYLCPCCLRSRRPRLETILSLLVDAHHITVRIPEVEALQCLTKRAMEWQLKARQMLDLPEVAVALAKLSILSQKKNENKAVAQKSTSSRATEGHSSSSISFEEGSRFSESGGQELSSVSDHCYLGDTPRKMSPVVVLCPPIRKRLEDVMMLGDLLEISLDESYHIWRVLQASKSPIDDPSMLQEGCGVKLVITKRMSNKYPGSAKIRIPLPHKRYRNAMKGNSSRTRVEKKVVQRIKKSPKDKEERCGAPRCVKPKDKEIDWVQCDGPCKRWFHLICVGLEKTDIKQTEDFYCGLCSGKKET